MPLLDMSTNISPTVNGSGYFSAIFPNAERVLNATVYYDQSVNITGDVSGGIDISVNVGAGSTTSGDTAASANNRVDIYPYVRATGPRRAAVTADLAGHKFTVIAKTE